MRKPDFCICENKDADQLLCFRHLEVQSLCFPDQNFQVSSHLLWLYSPFVSDLLRNPEDWFSDVAAHTVKLGFTGVYIIALFLL